MRLIDADAFADRILVMCADPKALRDALDEEPTVLMPVKRGRWQEESYEKWRCSGCGTKSSLNYQGFRFCPWCGIQMEVAE